MFWTQLLRQSNQWKNKTRDDTNVHSRVRTAVPRRTRAGGSNDRGGKDINLIRVVSGPLGKHWEAATGARSIWRSFVDVQFSTMKIQIIPKFTIDEH
jgi:hypothetical protein